jgi:hypothetical protein
MQGNNKRRELRRLAGVVALGTGILGMASPAVSAVAPAVPASAASTVGDNDIEALRRSGDAQAILAYIAQHPDNGSYSNLLMTLPKSVAREVHAGLAAALAKTPPTGAKPDLAKPGEKAAAKLFEEPDGHLPAGSQYEYELEDWGNPDINPGFRGGQTGGY